MFPKIACRSEGCRTSRRQLMDSLRSESYSIAATDSSSGPFTPEIIHFIYHRELALIADSE